MIVEYAEEGHADIARPSKRRERVSVTDELNEIEKSRFERYRKIRYQVSVDRGVPAYAVFTDKELALLSSLEELNSEGVKSLKGISPAHFLLALPHHATQSLRPVSRGVTSSQGRWPCADLRPALSCPH